MQKKKKAEKVRIKPPNSPNRAEYVLGIDTRVAPGKVEVLYVSFRKRMWATEAFKKHSHKIAHPSLPEFKLLIKVLAEQTKKNKPEEKTKDASIS